MFKLLADKLTKLLIKNNIIKDDEYDIYKYGFEMLVYFIFNISIALLIGVIFNRVIQTIIFLTCYCTIRQFTGGYHARNYTECTLTFMVMYIVINLIDINLDVDRYKYILLIMPILSTFVIYKISPLEHRNKPLTESDKGKYRSIAIELSLIASLVSILSLTFDILFNYMIYIIFALICISILLIIGKQTNKKALI